MGWRRLIKRKVLVNLKVGDGAFAGVLWSRSRDFLVLRGVEFRPEGSNVSTPMDGDVVVERSNVSFLQFPEGLE